MLKALYSRYRLKPSGGGLRTKMLKLDGWLQLCTDAHLVDGQFTLQDASLAFLWSRMYVMDEIKDYQRYTSLTFTDFLEALGRVADMKNLPLDSDLDAAGACVVVCVRDGGQCGHSRGPLSHSVAAALTRAHSGYHNILEWSMDKERLEGNPEGADSEANGDLFRIRDSAGFGTVKNRPLYVKLEMLLDLIFR